MGRREEPSAEQHRRVRDVLLGPYVLGALEPDEERVVEIHLEKCSACREEERVLRETHERLAGVAIANAAVHPSVKEGVIGALPPQNEGGATGATGEPSRLQRTRRVAVAAALLLALALGGYYAAGIVTAPDAETASLAPTALAPEARGELEMRISGAGAEADLQVWGLPETGPNEYYELWLGREEGRVSAGTFTVDEEGSAELSTTCPDVTSGYRGGYRRVGITLEKFPEEPRRDEAKVVLGGELPGV